MKWESFYKDVIKDGLSSRFEVKSNIVKTAVSYTLLPGFWIYMDRPIQRYHLAMSPLPCYSVTSTPHFFSGTLISTPFSLSVMEVRDHGIVGGVCNFPLYK